MHKLARIFSAFLAILPLTALPVFAYEVALKDGRVIHFQKYRATETVLLFIDDQGREISIPLSSVDLDRTRELNSKENPPLNLPGLITRSASSDPDSQPSLGDIARKLRNGEPKATRRAYTTEDFRQAETDSGMQTHHEGKEQDLAKLKEKARQVLLDLERETDQQAIKEILGQDARIQFPERPSWESKILVVRQKYLPALVQCLSDRVSERLETLKACDRFDALKFEYESLGREGRKLAASWSRE